MKFFVFLSTCFVLSIMTLPNAAWGSNAREGYSFRGVTLGSGKSNEMIPHTNIWWQGYGKTTQWYVGVEPKRKLIEVCERKNEKLSIGDISVDRIEYYYMDDKLLKVVIWANPYFAKDFDEIMALKFKEPYKNVNFITEPYILGKQYVKHVVINNQNLDLTFVQRWLREGVGDTIIEFSDIDLLKIYNVAIKEEEQIKQKKEAEAKRQATKDL